MRSSLTCPEDPELLAVAAGGEMEKVDDPLLQLMDRETCDAP